MPYWVAHIVLPPVDVARTIVTNKKRPARDSTSEKRSLISRPRFVVVDWLILYDKVMQLSYSLV